MSCAPALRIVRGSKPPVAPRKRAATSAGVVAQVRTACRPENRLAAALGALLGAVVPALGYVTAHDWLALPGLLRGEVAGFDASRGIAAVVLAGSLLFSAKTVFQWAALALRDTAKAVGFVLLVELTMVAIPFAWVSVLCLGYLVAINAVATACNLSQRGSP